MIVHAETLGEGAQLIAAWGKNFDFKDNILVPPTETFERELALKVGDTDVPLFNVGPAHTTGDTVIHSVPARPVYPGDLLFMEFPPAPGPGPRAGCLAACPLFPGMDTA